jgi:hypothetical protein
MSNNKALVNSDSNQWELIQRQCKAFLQSGFLPNHIRDIAQAITIAWKGHELGIPPLQAFGSITVINGKPCLTAELMLALIYSRVPGAKVTYKTPSDKANEYAEYEFKRPDGDAQTFRFSMDDADKAGLIRPKSPWTKYPAAMLRARCISAGARAVFPDAIMGVYTPEEMGADVNESGEPIEAEFTTVPKDTEAPKEENKKTEEQNDTSRS